MNNDPISSLRAHVMSDLRSADSESRRAFFDHFAAEAEIFAEHTAIALDRWARFHHAVEENDPRRRPVVAILYTAINLHSSSFKLFMSGHTTAAGGLFRQVLEAIATALLCSCKELPVLDQFLNDRYSTNNAVTHLLRNCEVVDVYRDGVLVLDESYKFYHMYAHLTKLTIATGAHFEKGGVPNIGAFFDLAKLPEYRKEVVGRVSLAKVLPSLVDGVYNNVQKWPPMASNAV